MKAFLKRHVLWAGFLAVLVPLTVMLVLQYRWLVELQTKSAIAHEATLKNYLEAVATKSEYHYKELATAALNLPAWMFIENRLDKAAYHFDKFMKKGPLGVKRFFVLSFVREDHGKALVYEPSIPAMEPPASAAEQRAIYVAAAPWWMLSEKRDVVETEALSVDERDPENRLIIHPVLDAESRVVGLAGLILDHRFFRDRLLPKVIDKSMPYFFSEADQKNLRVVVRGAKRDKLEEKFEAERAMAFVFRDYRIGLSSKDMNPKDWAQANFVLNMGLSAAIAVVLLGGVALALRTASREMKLSQMKNDFVSNVSHELRTPLASIRVFGEFLRLGRVTDPAKVSEYGEYIETESRRLTGLVNNILDFAKIESGRKTYRFESADLTDVVCETLKTFEVRLRHSGFEIRFDQPERPLPKVWLDADAIGQAVSNLLDNAVKYSGSARAIDVAVGQDNGYVMVSVKDQGIGISRDEQTKIFERFHRVSTGLVHDVKGSGLGLSIVNHIVQAHKGAVTVDSEPGRGSRFAIRLPVEETAGA
ncbi:MAG TPA: HAMP domain-containing sensor histidine kinase [Candidatus Polarisedimenticolia bacterium]|nr:HAMP domain-containing sensor histidine kinase [Candidatus Polarisedimenticolia bacterium]